MALSTTQSNYLSINRSYSVTDFTVIMQVYVSAIELNYSAFYGIDGSANSSLGLAGSGDRFALLDNSVDANGSTVLSAGNWYSVVWSRLAGVDTLEVDGVDQGVSSVGNSSAMSNAYIGRFGGGGFNIGKAWLDGIKVYDAALSRAEREAERMQIKPQRWADLFAWLPCNVGGVIGSDWSGFGDWSVTGTPSNQSVVAPITWGDSPLFVPQFGVATPSYFASPSGLLMTNY